MISILYVFPYLFYLCIQRNKTSAQIRDDSVIKLYIYKKKKHSNIPITTSFVSAIFTHLLKHFAKANKKIS